MMKLLRRITGTGSTYDAGRATVAGTAASVAYLAEMSVDLPLLDCPTNDLLLLGGIFTQDRRIWPVLGAVLHMGNGIALAQVYAAVAHRFPGPPWLRGTLFTLLENALLWGVLPIFDRIHPAIRSGALPKMNRPVPFLQQVLRHIAYGAVLGLVYGHGKRR